MKIICNHISKTFFSRNGKLKVLEDIDIETEDCDFICILGPNGCGKTTLLKIMAGVLAPSKGNIEYTGQNRYFQPTSLIFQGQGLFPWLNVMDNVCFGLEMNGISKKERYSKAEEYIEEMALNKFIDYYPHQLSMGMKQKVNLIRGLLMDSPILLIDEANVSLDFESKLTIQRDIYKIWEEYKKTIIYVTHDIDEALHLAKHIWIMSKSPGKIIREFDITSNALKTSGGEINNQLIYLKNEITDIIRKEAVKK